MSYDISIMGADALGDEYEIIEVGNYTYNCGGMFARMFEVGFGYPFRLTQADGVLCDNLLEAMRDGLEYWRANRDEFTAMNPTNGWGDEMSALAYMERLYDSCQRFPDGKVSVS